MKVLVWGAGVIGSYLSHVLCDLGQEVALLARGGWRETLERDGLVIRHALQRRTTVDHPPIVVSPTESGPYDVIFAVMQYQQMESLLPDLAAVDCPLVVLVGNNPDAPRMAEYIRTHSKRAKEVLFGFQATGGRREAGRVVCVRFSAGALACGGAEAPASQAAQIILNGIFAGGKYQLEWFDSMESVYLTHLAMILPISYLCYACGCDLRKTTRGQLNRGMDAIGEGYGLLSALGIPILPAGSERAFQPGAERKKMFWKLLLMARTPIGRLATSDHCRAATVEMAALDGAFQAVRERFPGFSMPGWDGLRRDLPDWETLRQTYMRA